MSCNNDWDTLKEIIVGTADFATIPDPNISILKCQFPEYEEDYVKKLYGSYPQQVIDEQNEDLQILSDTLTSLGVIVHRPDTQWANSEFKSPTWRGKNWHYYSPRDLHLIIGDIIIETPSPIWNRQFETWGYREVMMSLWKRGYKWIKAPSPILKEDNYREDTKGIPSLNNNEILFEAANCVRVGKDLIYQISNTGNWLGGEWLQSILQDYTVHTYDSIYSFAHLDSTILPLREGLVMYNSSRITEENEPDIFKSWDKIWIDECVSVGDSFGLPWGASEWIGMNMLSISPDLAIVDKKQREVHEKLNKVGINTIPLELRHDRLLAGGFHCVTLDLVRENGS
jgi:scyllo-inosamine-4-phosphate amidinotransferase 1